MSIKLFQLSDKRNTCININQIETLEVQSDQYSNRLVVEMTSGKKIFFYDSITAIYKEIKEITAIGRSDEVSK